MGTFLKTSLLDRDLQSKNDYLHFWQIWHHNWDDADVALIRELCSPIGKDVLEVGCGDGRISFALADECRQFVGIDLHPTLLERARSNLAATPDLIAKLKFIEMDACDLAFPDNSFDVVLFPWVLQMVSQPGKAVAEASRVLRSGGKALIIGLTSDSDYDRIIAEFVKPTPANIDVDRCYFEPINAQFQTIQKYGSRKFPYFFMDLDTAVIAFEFALHNWYATPCDDTINSQLRKILQGYQSDDGSVKLNFDAEIFSALKQ